MKGAKIGLLGAFDRNNYGDILFPIIAEQYLKEFIQQGYSFEYVSLVKSDLSSWGGKKTIAMSSFFKQLFDKDVLIVTGGEVLGALWKNMYFNLLEPEKDEFFIKLFYKYHKKSWFNWLIRKKFSCRHFMPWVIERKYLPSRKNLLIYNAVGAAGTVHLDQKSRQKLGKNIAQANFFAVRDKTSVDILQEVNKEVEIKLVPDSAILISDLYPKEFLNQLISEEAKTFRFAPGTYFCLQIGLHFCHTEETLKLLADQVRKIMDKTGLAVCLLPIGRALYHEDDKVLNALRKELNKENIFLPDHNTIYDVMYYIAYARFFAGTSLHGNITAMAYAVPQMALSSLDRKIPAYMNTWGVEGNNRNYEFEEMYDCLEKILSIPTHRLIEGRNRQQALARNNFNEIKQMIREQEQDYD